VLTADDHGANGVIASEPSPWCNNNAMEDVKMMIFDCHARACDLVATGHPAPVNRISRAGCW
jgi:hypothetical protein